MFENCCFKSGRVSSSVSSLLLSLQFPPEEKSQVLGWPVYMYDLKYVYDKSWT